MDGASVPRLTQCKGHSERASVPGIDSARGLKYDNIIIIIFFYFNFSFFFFLNINPNSRDSPEQ